LVNVQRHNDRVGHAFDITTDLAAPPEVVWKHAASVDGIKAEMKPLIRMTVPRRLADTTLDELPLGQRVARSWVLLFGILPVDYDDLTIVERGPGHRFLENSTMLTQSSWSHERIVEPTAAGSRLTDHLRWRGRARALGALYRVAIPVIFRHRHRRLRKLFGSRPDGRA
jgi:ligand-binding SRPBCC domain-containing protein